MKKIFSVLLIIFGSFLEVWYYQYRFINDGIEIWLAWTIGIALTLFLALAVFKKTTALIIVLIIYSVLATSAGQSFSLSQYENKLSTEDATQLNIQDEILDTENRINDLDSESEKIKTDINSSVNSLDDRLKYRKSIYGAYARIDEIEKERTILRDHLTELRNRTTTHEKIKRHETNIYKFYNGITSIPVNWLQFIFQTALSFFIALMAPLGILVITGNKKRNKKKTIKKEKINYRPWIERWVHVNWAGIRTKKSNLILPPNTFYDFTSQGNRNPFPKNIYNKILIAAREKKVLDTNVIKQYNQIRAVELILSALK